MQILRKCMNSDEVEEMRKIFGNRGLKKRDDVIISNLNHKNKIKT